MDLSTKRSLDRLTPRHKPYYQKLRGGLHLGYTKYATGAGRWCARVRTREKTQLGAPKYAWANPLVATEYGAARVEAESWASMMDTSRTNKRGTVRQALEAYLDWLRNRNRTSSAKEYAKRFAAQIYNTELGGMRLEDVTQDDFEDWRQKLKAGRAPRTVNRYVRQVVAALNQAVKMGHPGTRQAWSVEPLYDDIDAAETAVFLTPEQRAALITAASASGALFLRGLECTGARPGELAKATASDWDPVGETLTLRYKKGRPLKIKVRAVQFTEDEAAFLAKQAKGKLPTAPLFADADGKAWHKETWKLPLNEAKADVNAIAKRKDRVPDDAENYSFRHSWISERLQVHGVDPLTVAAQSGTSLQMIEKVYFKFIRGSLATKLRPANHKKLPVGHR